MLRRTCLPPEAGRRRLPAWYEGREGSVDVAPGFFCVELRPRPHDGFRRMGAPGASPWRPPRQRVDTTYCNTFGVARNARLPPPTGVRSRGVPRFLANSRPHAPAHRLRRCLACTSLPTVVPFCSLSSPPLPGAAQSPPRVPAPNRAMRAYFGMHPMTLAIARDEPACRATALRANVPRALTTGPAAR